MAKVGSSPGKYVPLEHMGGGISLGDRESEVLEGSVSSEVRSVVWPNPHASGSW